MSLWRLTRNEMAGAWRSLRYDLARRADGHGDPAVTRAGVPGGPRSPRLVAASAFGIVAVTGAAGSYLAVVNGVGSLLAEPVGPEPFPLVAEAAPRTTAPGTPPVTAQAGGTGEDVAPVPRGRVTVLTGPGGAVTAPTGAARQQATRTATVRATATARPRTQTRPTSAPRTPAPEPSCDCLNPPVPTPTSPPSATHGTPPSDGPSPTPEPSGTVSATPRTDAPATPGDASSDPGARDTDR
jgi:hypothetical protein